MSWQSMDLSPASREPMRPPAPARLVIFSLAIGLVINLLPWSGWALQIKPDFLLIVLLYWSTHESRNVGQGWGFTLGLVMDVADSVLLGQHALGYVAAIFLVQLLRLRLLQLSVLEQAMHVGAILFVTQLVNLLLNFLLGQDYPGISIIVPPLLGATLWPVLNFIVMLPRFRRRDPITYMG